MIKDIIDIHSHILPEVDDGAKSLFEATTMLQIAQQEGIEIIVATPHHHPRRGKTDVMQLLPVYHDLSELSASIGIRLYLGNEIFYDRKTITDLKAGRILTLHNTNTVLVEFEPIQSAFDIIGSVQNLQVAGYHVIIAHAERYDDLYTDRGHIERLYHDMGVDLQVNADCILGDRGPAQKKIVHSLLKNGYVEYVATDAHSIGRRAPRMQKAAELVKRKYGEEYMREIFCTNAKELLFPQS